MFWSYSISTGIVVNCENEDEAVLTADRLGEIVFEAELVTSGFEDLPSRWWRVLDADGSLYCETSDEEEARNNLRESDIDDVDDLVFGEIVPGRRLQRLYNVYAQGMWRDEV